ncbi:hypothetical protein OEZ86_010340 [Tetradesmus obliquus]|nr:hypothetical protein OEZ86_010340 [Tetradesmus obliquus]
MKRRAALAGSKTAVIFIVILLARSAAGAQDGVQKSNRQQVQQAQQGQNSGDRSDFLFIPVLIALAAAQRQYRAQLAPTYTPSPATTTTTTTTVTTSTPIPAYVATQQPDSSSSSSGKPADPAGTVLDLSTGSTTASADSPAGSGVAGSSADPAGTVLDLTTMPVGGLPAVPAAAAAAAITPKTFIFEQKGATRKILIGCALPFEGNQRVIGEAVFEAARMAIMDKAATLLPGVTVNLTCINSKCVDIPTYNAVYDLAEEKAVALLGEVCSGASVAAAGVSNAKKIPIISPSSTSPSLSQPDFFFRVVPSDTFQGSAIADLLVNSGHKNIGLVYEDTPYGYGLGFSFIASFTSHGGNVPVVVMFKKGQGNVADAIRQLQAGKASSTYPLDAAFVATGNVSFVADFLVAAKAANLGMQLYGGDSSANPELVEKIGARPSALSNFTVVAPFPGSAAFQQRFADLIKQGSADPLAAQSVYAARGYDAMTALLQAYAAAQGPKDGPAIVAALQRQNFTGVSGAVAFDKNGDLVATDKTYVFGQHTAKGGISVEGFVDIANDGVKVAAAAGR